MTRIPLRTHDLTLVPDSSRVILRPFIPVDTTRILTIIGRALELDEAAAARELDAVFQAFQARHGDLEAELAGTFLRVEPHVFTDRPLTRTRRLLIGALFSGEYALESAALFNPSLVAHPSQDGLTAGALRFIMSLRATGEGHISSIEFRTGTVAADGAIALDPVSGLVRAAAIDPGPGRRRRPAQARLPDQGFDPQWLADPSYELSFPAGHSLGDQAIFPASASERNGIEDARFVRFTEEDGSVRYYATYTAYDGQAIRPQLIETADFLRFQVRTLDGAAVRNKGMALFPRRIDGSYMMLSRQDDENLLVMASATPYDWSDPRIVIRPAGGWEAVKVGNCGSPLETEAGWLVLTHGVGPMRRYCIGAILLDLQDPTRVLGRLREPLLAPEGPGREGYVPNVVYSCGSLLHGRDLILPYAMSDRATTIVTVGLDDLLAALRT